MVNSVSRARSVDCDPGDLDPSEVPSVPVNAWHPSHLPVVIAPVAYATPSGKHFSAQLLETVKASKAVTKPVADFFSPPAWSDTPEAFKRLVCRSAGLSFGVITKRDGDLSEAEKNAIRSAARRLRNRADALLSL